MKKKIGILTFWNVPNYGAFLQAYALQKLLETRYPEYDVRQIPYLNQKHYNVYYSNSIKQNFRYWLINPKYYRALLSGKGTNKDVENTKKFLAYYDVIPHFTNIATGNIKDYTFDVLVLGSDIIWDFTVPFFGDDRYLFGVGINARKKLSYAPAFGSVSEKNSVPNYVKTGLRELDAISVRDEKSARIVEAISGKNAEVVLDPTLLWDFQNDLNIPKPTVSNYIVVYGSFFSEELVKGAKKYAEDNGLKLICLSSLDDRFEWCDEIINQDEMTPFEWVGYFKHASAVMTCTYHGLMFSIIFEKKIIFNMTEFIYNKSESFIDGLGMKEVLLNDLDFNAKMNWNWDYSIIYSKLNQMKSDSIGFLDSAIEGE